MYFLNANVCVCVYACPHVCVCMFVCVHAHARMSVYMHVREKECAQPVC